MNFLCGCAATRSEVRRVVASRGLVQIENDSQAERSSFEFYFCFPLFKIPLLITDLETELCFYVRVFYKDNTFSKNLTD